MAIRGSELAQVNTRLEQEIAERTRVEETLRRQNGYLAALHETTLGLISRLELKDLLENLVVRAARLVGTPHGFIYLAVPGDAELERKVGIGIFNEDRAPRLKPGEGLSGKVWQTGQSIVVDDYDTWPSRSTSGVNLVQAMAGVPLHSGSKVVGVLALAFERGSQRAFSGDEVELLTRFAQLASIALDNARLYAAAQEARHVADAANEAKSSFLASVSHELRTPLTSILGFARIIQKRLEERILPAVKAGDDKTLRAISQVRENIQIIIDESQRLTALINEVLDLAKIEAGKVEWHMQPLSVAEVIERATTATATLFEQKGLKLGSEVAAGLPPVLGDWDRLVQVLINLLSNALKFTERGSVICQAARTDGEVLIRVVDTGIGIAEADQPKVFEKFKQVGDTLTSKPQGTGLGLPICKEIVEHHGGRIWVESQPGGGSVFAFTLPVLESSMAQPPATIYEI